MFLCVYLAVSVYSGYEVINQWNAFVLVLMWFLSDLFPLIFLFVSFFQPCLLFLHSLHVFHIFFFYFFHLSIHFLFYFHSSFLQFIVSSSSYFSISLIHFFLNCLVTFSSSCAHASFFLLGFLFCPSVLPLYLLLPPFLSSILPSCRGPEEPEGQHICRQ